jgi:hypothetical protein
MEDKENQDLKRKRAIKISNIIAWCCLLWIPMLFIQIAINTNGSYSIFYFFNTVFLFFPLIVIIYAIVNKVFRITLLIPIVINCGIIFYLIYCIGPHYDNSPSAKDARIKAEMISMGSASAIYYNTTGSYTYGTAGIEVQGFTANFSGTGDGLSLYNDIGAQTSGARVLNIGTSGLTYCFSVVMNSSTYCVDSTGKVGTTACGSSYACP